MKTWFKRQPVENLEEWLKLATEDLCESAKSRIALEIETHFKEAVEAHISEDRSPIEAEALALEELGRPKAALKRFRKKHLTEKEDEKVENLKAVTFKSKAKSRLAIGTLGLACLIVAIPMLRTGLRSNLIFLVVFFSALMFFIEAKVSRFLVKNLPASSITRRLVLIHALFEIISGCVCAAICCWGFQTTSDALALFYCFAFVVGPMAVNGNPTLRIWNKLRNEKTGWDLPHSGSNPTSAS